jgi:hypothetical protein
VERDPVGREILEGVGREAAVLGLEVGEALLENTEENFQTLQTGVGLTVVGFVGEGDLRLGKTVPGDLLVAVGKPMVGAEVVGAEGRGEVAELRSGVWVSPRRYVHDIVPVGSLGIAQEAKMMAYGVGRQLKLADGCGLDLEKSAGPATVVLVTLNGEKLEEFTSAVGKPVTVVGEIL